MPELVSPGVDVSVIDQSFYAGSNQGTIPCFFIVTHQNKATRDGIAVGTLRDKANSLYLITSQRELAQTFGDPVFYTSGGTPLHGDELNEYGLLAVHHYLGIASRAYVLRADVDLSGLMPSAVPPAGTPETGTFWLNSNNTKWGLFTYSGTQFNEEVPVVIDEVSAVYAYMGKRTSLAANSTNAEVFGRTIDATVDGDGNQIVTVHGGNPPVLRFQVGSSATIHQITLTPGHSFPQIAAAINTYATTNALSLRAHVMAFSAAVAGGGGNPAFVHGGFYRLKLTSKEPLDFTLPTVPNGDTRRTVQSNVLKQLGIPETAEREPDPALGLEGDLAVVTLWGDNRIFQKLTAKTATNAVFAGTSGPVSAQWTWVGSKEMSSFTVPRSIWNWQRTRPLLVAATTAFTNAPNDGSFDIVVLDDYGDEQTFRIDVQGNTAVAPAASNGDNAAALYAKINNNAGLVQNGVIAAIDGTTGQLLISNYLGRQIRFDNDIGSVLGRLGIQAKTYYGRRFHPRPATSPPTGPADGDVWMKTTNTGNGADWDLRVFSGDARQYVGLSVLFFASDADATAALGGALSAGQVYGLYDLYGTGAATIQLRRYDGRIWDALSYEAGSSPPRPGAVDGTLWYNNNLQADIMVAQGGQWTGYRNAYGPTAEIILRATKPTRKSDGTALAANDLWIDTSDLENYPRIYRYMAANNEFAQIDTTDNTSASGIIFRDARQDPAASGATRIQDVTQAMLMVSNDVDADLDLIAPATSYPDGMLLFNTRWSTGTVKRWTVDYRYGGVAVGNRWVTVSGTHDRDGRPPMLRYAQRKMITTALAATIAANQDVRAESVFFNLMACPGYPELIDEMVTLNVDKKETAFIVADTPARLKPDGRSIIEWADNFYNVESDGDLGLVTADPYVGIYYPWGLSVNTDGREVMVPPSAMVMRVMAYNDAVAYPWLAPAGYNRGMVTNATTVGYLTAEEEFKPTILNQGQRDVLYTKRINPIAYIPNRGLVVYGNKTLARVDSALDRVNVARLVNYLRWYLEHLAKPFLFEPNNMQTRDGARITFERFLADLIGLQALYDFAVVCDETNNTPTRIDRNELWIDVGIQPQKAIEFIYIPVRILNTGEDFGSFSLAQATPTPRVR